MQAKEKLINKTWENGKKPNFRLDFGPFGPFYFKNLALSVTRYHGQLSSCKISEKINDPVLRLTYWNETDRLTYRQTDRQTSDFMGCWHQVSKTWHDWILAHIQNPLIFTQIGKPCVALEMQNSSILTILEYSEPQHI